MPLISSTIFSIIGYFVLLFICTNLTGMVVRGFYVQDTDLLDLIKQGIARPYTKKGFSFGNTKDKTTTIVFGIITILFLLLLIKYMNLWAFLSALILIVSRIPDLIWEIKNGKKTTMDNKPTGLIYTLTGLSIIIALPILWYSIYVLLK